MTLTAWALAIACFACVVLAGKVMEVRTSNGHLHERVTKLIEEKASVTRRLHEANLRLHADRDARRRDDELIRLQRAMIRMQKRWNRFHAKRAEAETDGILLP